MKSLTSIRLTETPHLLGLIDKAAEFKKIVLKGDRVPQSPEKVVGMLFFENSTRTRVSFEQAANYLGMRHCSFADGGSSMGKGETLKDTLLTLKNERLDALVIRHKFSGTANLAKQIFGGPVINAGDGQHEHPTQALGDALTIRERKGDFEDLTVAIVGDVLHSRVARSNAWMLSKLGASVRFVGPKTLIPGDCSLLPGKVYHDLASGIADADVVMCLRLQKERMVEGMLGSVGEYASMYQINRDTLKFADRDCIVMHPGPLNRGVELDDAAADGERSAILNQVENGVFVRMAALSWAFEPGPEDEPAKFNEEALI